MMASITTGGPSLWVEPKPGVHGGWGKGAVQLFEIPTRR